MKHNRFTAKGFTLVELVISITVIAILATISSVMYSNSQQLARSAHAQATSAQMREQIDLAKVRSKSYPLDIDSCPIPVTGSACLEVPNNYNAYYTRIEPGARPSPVYAGITAAQSYEFALSSDELIVYSSNAERTGTNEFVQYMDMAPIIDQNGLIKYQISFDIKSADTSRSNNVNVYLQNGAGSRYSFGAPVTVSTKFERKTITVTPADADDTTPYAVLAFYSTYGTGSIITIKNLEIIRAN